MMSKFKKGILYFSILVLSAVFLTGCSLTGDDPQSSTSRECYGQGKEIEGNTDLSAQIVNVGDNLEVEKRTFTLGELRSLQFGMTGLKGPEEYYGTYELCDLQTGEYLEKGEYIYENWTRFEQVSNPDVTESSGNTTYFLHEVEGVEELYVPSPGKYAVYTFTSTGEGSDWKLSDSLEFTVTE